MGNFMMKGGVNADTAQRLIGSVSQEGDISQLQTGDIYGVNKEGTEFQQIETSLLPTPQLIIPSILESGHGVSNLMSVQGSRDTSLSDARLGQINSFHF